MVWTINLFVQSFCCTAITMIFQGHNWSWSLHKLSTPSTCPIALCKIPCQPRPLLLSLLTPSPMYTAPKLQFLLLQALYICSFPFQKSPPTLLVPSPPSGLTLKQLLCHLLQESFLTHLRKGTFSASLLPYPFPFFLLATFWVLCFFFLLPMREPLLCF